MKFTRLRAIFVGLLLHVGSVAQGDSMQQEALVLYREAARAYSAADYRVALDRFQQSFGRYGSASTMFNIAQCYRQLNQHAEAARAYRKYLELKPTAADAGNVRTLIERQEALARSPPPPRAATVEAPASTPSPLIVERPSPARSREDSQNRTGLVIGVSLGVVLVVGLGLGVGLGVGLQSRGPRSDLGTVRPEFN